MTTLNKQIELLNKQLQWNQQADNAKHIIEEYKLIRNQLFDIDEALKAMHNRFQALQALPDDAPRKMEFSVDVLEVARSALSALQNFVARWEKEGHEARQGDDLALTVKSLNSFISAGSKEEYACWQEWCGSLKGLVALEDILLEMQKNIPGLEKIHASFVKSRSQFRELVAKFPEDTEDIAKLQRLSVQMQDLKNKMQFDLPEEVATFFKELDNMNRRVSLAKITKEVFEWLRSNNLLDAYVVSRRDIVSGY
jgi:predicted  nucleic acid-binding Zn-ribbon protein